ncbi:MAG: hypothetical protein WCH98_08570 [Verrucomicrobiota bacterium]
MRLLYISLPLLLLAIEGGVQTWRHVGILPSTAPVFCWKGTPLLTTAPPPFGKALEMYRADRGAEQTMELPEGRKMTLFYFEWDGMTLGPFIDLSGHAAEVCNVDYGSFKLVHAGDKRIYTATNGEALYFNYTLLTDPNGQPVHVYKIPWVQGFGEWVSTPSVDRITRLRRSFLRHRGAARVLEAGIFGAANEDEAWALFEREVLEMLVWRR